MFIPYHTLIKYLRVILEILEGWGNVTDEAEFLLLGVFLGFVLQYFNFENHYSWYASNEKY